MPLPVYFPVPENTLDETTGLPSVKLAAGRKTAFGGGSMKNYLMPENSGGTTSAANHVGYDSSRVYNTKDSILAKMALLYNAHGGVVTPDFGTAVTSTDEPFNFAGIALSDSPDVVESWVQKLPAAGDVSPPQRSNFQLAYHGNIQRIVAFGGVDNFVLKNDTWEWDGQRWVQKIFGTTPSARQDYAMVGAVFSGTPSVFLYGGKDSSAGLNDTWSYFGNSWYSYSPGTNPGQIWNHAMAFDSKRGKIVLFGGSNGDPLNDTWEFDPGSLNWAQITTAHSPDVRQGHAMAFDSSRNRTVVFSGSNGDPDTWEYDGTDWTKVFPIGTLPSARTGARMVFNSVTKKIIMFGGVDANQADLNDTWEYDGITWTQLNTVGPSPREYFGMAYDSNRDKVVVFGGANTTIIGGNSETWELGSPIRPVVVQATGEGFVYYDASSGRPTPVVGDFLGPSAAIGTITPIYDGYSPVFGVAADGPVPLGTVLSDTIDSVTTTISVGTTTGFPSTGTIFIDDEQITYAGTTSSTFTGCTRGANSTTAIGHLAGIQVFSTVPLTTTVNGSTVGIIKMRIRPFYGFIPPLPPSITQFTPNAASVGDDVILTGTVFIGATQVTINGTPSANATFDVISNNQITFTIPAGAQKGTITVTNAQGNSTSSNIFTTLPTITSVFATSYSVGSTVSILGHTFTYTSAVKFNGVDAASFTVQNDGYVSAVIPAGGSSGDIDLTITYPVGPSSHTVTYQNFSVVPPPTITNVAPLSGASGDLVGITGTGLAVGLTGSLDGYCQVDFVDVATQTQVLPATRTVFNDTTISAVVPTPGSPQPSTNYYVRITTNGGIVLSSQEYTIIPVPKFQATNSFSPTSGIAGDTINILGDYGFTGLQSVSFAGYASTSITFINDGFIQAVVPTVSSSVDITGPIRVTSAGGTRKTDDSSPSTTPTTFTILQSPTITSISPTSGKTGDTIIITGTNLLAVSYVAFTGSPDAYATFTIVNSTRINVTVPSTSSGIVSAPSQGPIKVVKGVLAPVASSQNFLFYPPPTGLTLASPAADGGGINGGAGTSIQLTGSNLTQGGTPTVTVGTKTATVTSASPGSVLATVPSGASSGITLTTSGGSIGPITFNYLQPCTISSYSPASAPANYGGDTVYIYGSNFRPSPYMTLYATDPAQGYMVAYLSFTYVNSTQIYFNSTQLSSMAGFYPSHPLYFTVVTNYPGGTYSSYIYGFVATFLIG